MLQAAKRWRPLVKRLYLRAHPDLLWRHGDAREQNEVAMQDLENVMATRPQQAVPLRFHVLCSSKERVEKIVETSVPACTSDEQWRKSVDLALCDLLAGIVPASQLPLPRPQPQQPVAYDVLGVLERAARRRRQRGAKEAAEEELLDVESARQPAVDVRDVTAVMRLLFSSGRIRCTEDVDPEGAMVLVRDALLMSSHEVLEWLVSPIMSDLHLLVTDEVGGLRGRVLHLNMQLKPREVAEQLEQVVETLTAVHGRGEAEAWARYCAQVDEDEDEDEDEFEGAGGGAGAEEGRRSHV